jgi:ketosteroid isomerase-like protein
MSWNKPAFFGLVLALGITISGCAEKRSSDGANLEEAKQAIAKSNAIYFESFVKNDSSIFTDRYADDCCIMAPGIPAQCGAGAAARFFREAYDKVGLRNGKFITTEIYGAGDGYVVEMGLWQSFKTGNVMFDDGKFLVLWKKTDKGWKMFRDSFSSNHP